MIVIDYKILRLITRVFNFDPYWALFWGSEGQIFTFLVISAVQIFLFFKFWTPSRAGRVLRKGWCPYVHPSMCANVRACVRNPVISGTAPQFFLKFCMKLSGPKVRKVMKSKFWKQFWTPRWGKKWAILGSKINIFENIPKILPHNVFIFSMLLEPTSRLKLGYMSYFQKFWFAGGKGSNVKFCPFLACKPVILGTTPQFFFWNFAWS